MACTLTPLRELKLLGHLLAKQWLSYSRPGGRGESVMESSSQYPGRPTL